MAEPSHSSVARLRTQAANVDRAMADLETIVDSAGDGVARLRAAPRDVFTLMGAGGLLHGFYSTLEGLMRDIAESLNGFVPSSADWHARLLDQMSRDVPGVRPALFGDEIRPRLDELRAFRHLYRNLYVFNLRAGPIEALLATLPDLWTALGPGLVEFARMLRAMAEALESSESPQ